jgi:4-oxalomesaconate hydratase
MPQPSILVFSAHAADFCSRSGGTIALHVRRGGTAHVVDVTFGERGESEDYWKRPGPKSEEEAKKVRAAEAEGAARILGATIEFLDYGDYPLFLGKERIETMTRIVRARKPDIILTHWNCDPTNPDHHVTASAVLRAASIAAMPGFDPQVGKIPFPYIFGFEPSVPHDNITGFRPDHFVAIDEVFDLKMEALTALRSQSKLVQYYTQWAEFRGFQARQWAGRPIRYAEAFQCFTAVVDTGLPYPAPR